MRQGSLTIFFSMILLSLFSLFFSMVETLRIYEMRLESRSVTKIAMANAFSEYQPYLWKTYGILALDVGYGTEDFDLAHIEKRLSDFAWENCLGSEKEHGLELFSIEPEQAEVTAYGLLTDDEGAALICQGAEVARQQILQGIWETWDSKYGQVADDREVPDVGQIVAQAKKGIEVAKEQKTEEGSAGNEQVAEDQMSSTPVEKVRENPLELFSQIKEQGLLGLVLKDQVVSEKTLATAIGLEERLLCQGSGEKRREVSGYDRICFDWYVLQEFSHFDREVSADRALSYEVEYLIAGKASDRENLEAVVLRLLAMREVQNAEVILTDPTMMGQAYEIALALAGASVNPALVQVVQVAVVAVWALVESILDLCALLDGKKIPMLKTRAQWKSQLGALQTALDGGEDTSVQEGIGYQEYLFALLALLPQKKLAYGCMDLMEASMQQQEDYAYVKMDHMVYTMDISCSFAGQGLFDAFLPMQPLWVDLYRSECQETLYY